MYCYIAIYYAAIQYNMPDLDQYCALQYFAIAIENFYDKRITDRVSVIQIGWLISGSTANTKMP